MRILLAFVAGVWLTLVFIGINPHTTSPGVMALIELVFPLLALVSVAVIRREWHDRASDRNPTPGSGRQQAPHGRNR